MAAGDAAAAAVRFTPLLGVHGCQLLSYLLECQAEPLPQLLRCLVAGNRLDDITVGLNDNGAGKRLDHQLLN